MLASPRLDLLQPKIHFIFSSMVIRKMAFRVFLTLIFVRVILVGWQHPFYTAFIGIGLAISRLNQNLPIKIIAPGLGWCIAVFTHAFHNTLASFLSGVGGLIISTAVDWTGWLFMLGVIIFAILQEQRTLQTQLEEEVQMGIISPAQYRTACSALAQSAARFSSLANGKYLATNQFYQLTAELAHKKHQRTRMGEEDGNTLIIEKLRSELARLSLSLFGD